MYVVLNSPSGAIYKYVDVLLGAGESEELELTWLSSNTPKELRLTLDMASSRYVPVAIAFSLFNAEHIVLEVLCTTLR